MSINSDKDVLRLRTLAALAALLIVGLVAGATYVGISTGERFTHISNDWNEYNSGAELKGSLLNKIRADFGYGGFIHAFKNYVLRQDPRLLEVVEEKLSAVKASLLKYNQLHVTDDERQAQSVIQDTVKQYEAKLPIAIEAVSQGLTPLEVDVLVKVDDGPAFDAFQLLALEWASSHGAVMEEIERDIGQGEQIIQIGMLMAVLFAVAAAVLLWLLRMIMRELLTVQKSLNQEIEEHDQAEGALRDSEERFRAFADYTPNKLHIKDTEGRYVLINRKSEELLGVTNAEAKGKTASELFSSEVADVFWEHNRAVLETGQATEQEEVFQEADGPHTYLTIKFPILGTDGDIVAVGSSGFDITERKRAEEELIQHHDFLETMVDERTVEVTANAIKLEHALAREKEYNVLQQKFVALVSHEFRTPLTIIDGAAQRLIRRKDKLDADEVETRANKVRAAVTRMVGLIDTTLYASRLDAGKIEMKITPCDIGELLLDVCERHSEISPSHQIRATLDDLPGEIFADRRLLDMVFTNLLSNAIKYSPDSPLIEIKGWSDEDNALISITDQGLGISANDLPHMFGRFFRAKTAEGIKGTGIGLNVAKEFVKLHGGSVGVDSLEGEGSTFTVRIPISGLN